MNDHAQAMTLSERADAIEEHMMHELERIVVKSVLFNLADGRVNDDTAATPAQNAGQADPGRLFQVPLCVDLSFAAERGAREKGRSKREGDHGLPAA
jgi:hypothetical protein